MNGPYILTGDAAERLARQIRYPRKNQQAIKSFGRGQALVDEFRRRGYAVVVPRVSP